VDNNSLLIIGFILLHIYALMEESAGMMKIIRFRLDIDIKKEMQDLPCISFNTSQSSDTSDYLYNYLN